MPTYVATHYQYLQVNENTHTITNVGQLASAQTTRTGTFSVGNSISVGTTTVTYIGHTSNGWIGKIGLLYIYYTGVNEPLIPPITYSTGEFVFCFLAGTMITTADGGCLVEYEALYGEAGATIAELDLPRIKSARQLPAAIRQRLQERAVALLGASTATAAPASSAA